MPTLVALEFIASEGFRVNADGRKFETKSGPSGAGLHVRICGKLIFVGSLSHNASHLDMGKHKRSPFVRHCMFNSGTIRRILCKALTDVRPPDIASR